MRDVCSPFGDLIRGSNVSIRKEGTFFRDEVFLRKMRISHLIEGCVDLGTFLESSHWKSLKYK